MSAYDPRPTWRSGELKIAFGLICLVASVIERGLKGR